MKGATGMRIKGIGIGTLGTALLIAAASVSAQNPGQNSGRGQAVVTVLPKGDSQVSAGITDLAVKVDGKKAKVTTWEPYRAPNNKIELVLLIDGAARSSLGEQMGDIERFVKSLPPNVVAGIAYMENGRAALSSPLTSNRVATLQGLHLPGGVPGIEASPYFCLSDLAKHWPGQNAEARREVVMITDGVDNYERRYDPEDPYVEAAINDSVRARLVVYSIYWMNQGRFSRTWYAANDGQNLLTQLTEATGGKSFWQGMGNPVSFQPYFDELVRRFRNQYELAFASPVEGKPGVENLKLSLHAPETEIDAPRKVLVISTGSAQK